MPKLETNTPLMAAQLATFKKAMQSQKERYATGKRQEISARKRLETFSKEGKAKGKDGKPTPLASGAATTKAQGKQTQREAITDACPLLELWAPLLGASALSEDGRKAAIQAFFDAPEMSIEDFLVQLDPKKKEEAALLGELEALAAAEAKKEAEAVAVAVAEATDAEWLATAANPRGPDVLTMFRRKSSEEKEAAALHKLPEENQAMAEQPPAAVAPVTPPSREGLAWLRKFNAGKAAIASVGLQLPPRQQPGQQPEPSHAIPGVTPAAPSAALEPQRLEQAADHAAPPIPPIPDRPAPPRMEKTLNEQALELVVKLLGSVVSPIKADATVKIADQIDALLNVLKNKEAFPGEGKQLHKECKDGLEAAVQLLRLPATELPNTLDWHSRILLLADNVQANLEMSTTPQDCGIKLAQRQASKYFIDELVKISADVRAAAAAQVADRQLPEAGQQQDALAEAAAVAAAAAKKKADSEVEAARLILALQEQQEVFSEAGLSPGLRKQAAAKLRRTAESSARPDRKQPSSPSELTSSPTRQENAPETKLNRPPRHRLRPAIDINKVPPDMIGMTQADWLEISEENRWTLLDTEPKPAAEPRSSRPPSPEERKRGRSSAEAAPRVSIDVSKPPADSNISLADWREFPLEIRRETMQEAARAQPGTELERAMAESRALGPQSSEDHGAAAAIAAVAESVAKERRRSSSAGERNLEGVDTATESLRAQFSELNKLARQILGGAKQLRVSPWTYSSGQKEGQPVLMQDILNINKFDLVISGKKSGLTAAQNKDLNDLKKDIETLLGYVDHRMAILQAQCGEGSIQYTNTYFQALEEVYVSLSQAQNLIRERQRKFQPGITENKLCTLLIISDIENVLAQQPEETRCLQRTENGIVVPELQRGADGRPIQYTRPLGALHLAPSAESLEAAARVPVIEEVKEERRPAAGSRSGLQFGYATRDDGKVDITITFPDTNIIVVDDIYREFLANEKFPEYLLNEQNTTFESAGLYAVCMTTSAANAHDLLRLSIAHYEAQKRSVVLSDAGYTNLLAEMIGHIQRDSREFGISSRMLGFGLALQKLLPEPAERKDEEWGQIEDTPQQKQLRGYLQAAEKGVTSALSMSDHQTQTPFATDAAALRQQLATIQDKPAFLGSLQRQHQAAMDQLESARKLVPSFLQEQVRSRAFEEICRTFNAKIDGFVTQKPPLFNAEKAAAIKREFFEQLHNVALAGGELLVVNEMLDRFKRTISKGLSQETVGAVLGAARNEFERYSKAYQEVLKSQIKRVVFNMVRGAFAYHLNTVPATASLSDEIKTLLQAAFREVLAGDPGNDDRIVGRNNHFLTALNAIQGLSNPQKKAVQEIAERRFKAYEEDICKNVLPAGCYAFALGQTPPTFDDLAGALGPRGDHRNVYQELKTQIAGAVAKTADPSYRGDKVDAWEQSFIHLQKLLPGFVQAALNLPQLGYAYPQIHPTLDAFQKEWYSRVKNLLVEQLRATGVAGSNDVVIQDIEGNGRQIYREHAQKLCELLGFAAEITVFNSARVGEDQQHLRPSPESVALKLPKVEIQLDASAAGGHFQFRFKRNDGIEVINVTGDGNCGVYSVIGAIHAHILKNAELYQTYVAKHPMQQEQRVVEGRAAPSPHVAVREKSSVAARSAARLESLLPTSPRQKPAEGRGLEAAAEQQRGRDVAAVASSHANYAKPVYGEELPTSGRTMGLFDYKPFALSLSEHQEWPIIGIKDLGNCIGIVGKHPSGAVLVYHMAHLEDLKLWRALHLFLEKANLLDAATLQETNELFDDIKTWNSDEPEARSFIQKIEEIIDTTKSSGEHILKDVRFTLVTTDDQNMSYLLQFLKDRGIKEEQISVDTHQSEIYIERATGRISRTCAPAPLAAHRAKPAEGRGLEAAAAPSAVPVAARGKVTRLRVDYGLLPDPNADAKRQAIAILDRALSDYEKAVAAGDPDPQFGLLYSANADQTVKIYIANRDRNGMLHGEVGGGGQATVIPEVYKFLVHGVEGNTEKYAVLRGRIYVMPISTMLHSGGVGDVSDEHVVSNLVYICEERGKGRRIYGWQNQDANGVEFAVGGGVGGQVSNFTKPGGQYDRLVGPALRQAADLPPQPVKRKGVLGDEAYLAAKVSSPGAAEPLTLQQTLDKAFEKARAEVAASAAARPAARLESPLPTSPHHKPSDRGRGGLEAAAAIAPDHKKVAEIIQKQATTLAELQAFAQHTKTSGILIKETKPDPQWASIQAEHFDWWMFPVLWSAKSTGESKKYGLGAPGSAGSLPAADTTKAAAEITVLQSNANFLTSYRAGVKLVARSWGWNLDTGKLEDGKGQKWESKDTYIVRLQKMLASLHMMGQGDLIASVMQFVRLHNITLDTLTNHNTAGSYVANGLSYFLNEYYDNPELGPSHDFWAAQFDLSRNPKPKSVSDLKSLGQIQQTQVRAAEAAAQQSRAAVAERKARIKERLEVVSESAQGALVELNLARSSALKNIEPALAAKDGEIAAAKAELTRLQGPTKEEQRVSALHQTMSLAATDVGEWVDVEVSEYDQNGNPSSRWERKVTKSVFRQDDAATAAAVEAAAEARKQAEADLLSLLQTKLRTEITQNPALQTVEQLKPVFERKVQQERARDVGKSRRIQELTAQIAQLTKEREAIEVKPALQPDLLSAIERDANEQLRALQAAQTPEDFRKIEQTCVELEGRFQEATEDPAAKVRARQQAAIDAAAAAQAALASPSPREGRGGVGAGSLGLHLASSASSESPLSTSPPHRISDRERDLKAAATVQATVQGRNEPPAGQPLSGEVVAQAAVSSGKKRPTRRNDTAVRMAKKQKEEADELCKSGQDAVQKIRTAAAEGREANQKTLELLVADPVAQMRKIAAGIEGLLAAPISKKYAQALEIQGIPEEIRTAAAQLESEIATVQDALVRTAPNARGAQREEAVQEGPSSAEIAEHIRKYTEIFDEAKKEAEAENRRAVELHSQGQAMLKAMGEAAADAKPADLKAAAVVVSTMRDAADHLNEAVGRMVLAGRTADGPGQLTAEQRQDIQRACDGLGGAVKQIRENADQLEAAATAAEKVASAKRKLSKLLEEVQTTEDTFIQSVRDLVEALSQERLQGLTLEERLDVAYFLKPYQAFLEMVDRVEGRDEPNLSEEAKFERALELVRIRTTDPFDKYFKTGVAQKAVFEKLCTGLCNKYPQVNAAILAFLKTPNSNPTLKDKLVTLAQRSMRYKDLVQAIVMQVKVTEPALSELKGDVLFKEIRRYGSKGKKADSQRLVQLGEILLQAEGLATACNKEQEEYAVKVVDAAEKKREKVAVHAEVDRETFLTCVQQTVLSYVRQERAKISLPQGYVSAARERRGSDWVDNPADQSRRFFIAVQAMTDHIRDEQERFYAAAIFGRSPADVELVSGQRTPPNQMREPFRQVLVRELGAYIESLAADAPEKVMYKRFLEQVKDQKIALSAMLSVLASLGTIPGSASLMQRPVMKHLETYRLLEQYKQALGACDSFKAINDFLKEAANSGNYSSFLGGGMAKTPFAKSLEAIWQGISTFEDRENVRNSWIDELDTLEMYEQAVLGLKKGLQQFERLATTGKSVKGVDRQLAQGLLNIWRSVEQEVQQRNDTNALLFVKRAQIRGETRLGSDAAAIEGGWEKVGEEEKGDRRGVGDAQAEAANASGNEFQRLHEEDAGYEGMASAAVTGPGLGVQPEPLFLDSESPRPSPATTSAASSTEHSRTASGDRTHSPSSSSGSTPTGASALRPRTAMEQRLADIKARAKTGQLGANISATSGISHRHTPDPGHIPGGSLSNAAPVSTAEQRAAAIRARRLGIRVIPEAVPSSPRPELSAAEQRVAALRAKRSGASVIPEAVLSSPRPELSAAEQRVAALRAKRSGVRTPAVERTPVGNSSIAESAAALRGSSSFFQSPREEAAPAPTPLPAADLAGAAPDQEADTPPSHGEKPTGSGSRKPSGSSE